MNDDPLSSIVLILIFVCCSAFFSATETAFSSLNRTRIRTLAEKGDKRAKRTLALLTDYDKLLSSILVGNNLVNIAMASVGTILFIGLLPNIGATVSTLVITVVVLFFGEISPKTMARENPERFAMIATPIMRVVVGILKPVNYLCGKWQNALRRIFKLGKDDAMTEEELSMLVEDVAQEGSIEADEEDLVRSALAFDEQEALDILTPRVDMTAVEVHTNNREVAHVFCTCMNSRLPVYEGDLDHIVGILYEKDFYTEDGISKTPIKDLMREPVFVPNTMKIDDLLQVLKEHKSHLAVVSDEFGGTMGIVTMEDILEELVGEIWDEHDEEVELFSQVSDHTFRVQGSADRDQMERFLGQKLDSDAATVGGWVTEQMGDIPEVGDDFTFQDLHITVTKADGNRVQEIEVQQKEEA